MYLSKKEFSDGIAWGIVEAFIVIAFSLSVGFYVVSLFEDKDSTDSEDKRSGMGLHVDELSGCHYLSRNGGLIQRMNNGKHYGCK